MTYSQSEMYKSCKIPQKRKNKNSPENMGQNIVKRSAESLTDDVRRDIANNFMLT